MDSRKKAAVFSLVFFIPALVGFFFAIWDSSNAKASLAWPSIQGRITSSRLVAVKGKSTSYEPRVGYEYSVAGQAYTGNRIWFGWPLAAGSEAEGWAVVHSYQVGAPVEVFYDPASPADAVLERRVRTWMIMFLWIGGLCFITLGVAVLIASRYIKVLPVNNMVGSH